MAKTLLMTYPNYQKNVLDSLIMGDKTWFHFYEPKRKVDNTIYALKLAKRSGIAKRTLAAKKVLQEIFF